MACIGIFDSGSGGLSVLKEILKVLPSEKYIYFSDDAYCPYGGRSREYIIDRSLKIVESLVDEGAQAIVVACNTATGAAIQSLRENWPDIPFIGMEPAIKPAVALSRKAVVGVLATESTLHSEKYLHTKQSCTRGVKVVERVGEGFVELVEGGRTSGPEAEAVVERSLRPILSAGADVVVLGCTHYPFLLPVMKSLAGPEIQFVDPAPAVARHLVELLEAQKIPFGEGELSVEIKSSGSAETARRLYDNTIKLAL
ncbi:MAG: glutamate racemase [Candidatus Cryptobacteroides sp.]